MRRSLVFGFSFLISGTAGAATIEIGPSANLGQEIANLSPGDELVLQGGTYTLTSKLTISVSGTAAQPIVIRAKTGETPHITRDASQNVINIENAQYVELRGLEVSAGSHGIRMLNSSYITIEECHIHDTADVALSANVGGSQYQGLRILRNHIHHTNGTGEGMYLGCNNDGCQMFDSLIEGNYVHDTNQSSVVQGDGIEIKHGSYNNIVRDNVIHGTNYPCILVYGTAGKAPNLIERNAMWDCGDHGIQAEADAIIRNNLVLSAAADGIRNQNHQQQSVEDLVIVHNTVLNTGDAIRSDNIAMNVLIANNALYSASGNALRASGTLAQLTVAGNVGTGSLQGVSGGVDTSGSLANDFVDAAQMNVFPKAGSKLIAAGDPSHVTADDFNGTDRGGVADVGAYKYDAAGNPGWTVGPGFKDVTGSSGSGGAGGSSGAGTGGSSGAGTGGSSGAGTGGSGTGGSGTGGSSGSAAGSAGAAPSDSGDDGGCGCRTSPSSTGGSALLLLVAMTLLGRRRHKS